MIVDLVMGSVVQLQTKNLVRDLLLQLLLH